MSRSKTQISILNEITQIPCFLRHTQAMYRTLKVCGESAPSSGCIQAFAFLQALRRHFFNRHVCMLRNSCAQFFCDFFCHLFFVIASKTTHQGGEQNNAEDVLDILGCQPPGTQPLGDMLNIIECDINNNHEFKGEGSLIRAPILFSQIVPFQCAAITAHLQPSDILWCVSYDPIISQCRPPDSTPSGLSEFVCAAQSQDRFCKGQWRYEH